MKIVTLPWTLFVVAGFALFIYGCEEEVSDPVEETTALLVEHNWRFEGFQVRTETPELPIPALAGLDVNPGEPQTITFDDLLTIIGLENDLRGRQIQFGTTGNILEETVDEVTGERKMEYLGSRYAVTDSERMRLAIHYGWFYAYDYSYEEFEQRFTLSATDSGAMAMLRAFDKALLQIIVSGAPHAIADAIVDKILGSEEVHQAINQFLYNALHGKIESFLAETPEKLAGAVAKAVVQLLGKLDLEGLLKTVIQKKLDGIVDIDVEQVSGDLAHAIATAIGEIFSEQRIAELLLPYLEKVENTNPAIAAKIIANALVRIIGEVLTEERLAQIIEPLWQKFTELDEAEIAEGADLLATVVQEKWINETTLYDIIFPVAQKIDETPMREMAKLAAEIVAQLQLLVEEIEARFPDVELDPDWDQIQSVLTLALSGAKSAIAITGPEKAAEDLVTLLLENYLTHEFFVEGFTRALQALQHVDPAVAAQVLAGWLAQLGEIAAPQVVKKIEAALLPILEAFDAEQAANELARLLHGKITDALNEDAIYELIYPIVEAFANLNTAAIAEALVQLIIDSGVIDPGVAEETIKAILLPIFESLIDADPDEVTQKLVDAILGSEIINKIITPERLSNMIRYKLYDVLIGLQNIVSSVEAIEMTLVHE